MVTLETFSTLEVYDLKRKRSCGERKGVEGRMKE